MSRLLVIIMFLSNIFLVNAQTPVIAEKEKLGTIPISDGPLGIRYRSSEEGFYSPGGIKVNEKCELFFIQSFPDKPILFFKNGEWLEKPNPVGLPENWFGPSGVSISQQGYTGVGSRYFKLNDDKYIEWYHVISETEYSSSEIVYRIPSGALWEPSYRNGSIGIEYYPDGKFKLYTFNQVRTWLTTQPGGFSIGDDGLLYRNGMLWSAVKPKGKEQYDWRYLGRLISGHVIWALGSPESTTSYTIVNASGEIELTMKIDVKTPYNYGLGPWGEFYFLHAPPRDKSYDPMGPYVPDASIPAELAVYRSHLKFFGRLNDGGVRLRKEPNTTSDILGTYPNKTGFRILETGSKQETIGGQTAHWYKVRLLDGTEGWFFGAFVHNLYDGPNGKAPPWPNVPDW